MTAADLDRIADLGVNAIIDLRRDDECEALPGPLPCLRLALPSREVPDTSAGMLQTLEAAHRWFLEDYQAMLASCAQAFACLLTEVPVPASPSSTAPQARTGPVWLPRS